jgi:hypothetical protein
MPDETNKNIVSCILSSRDKKSEELKDLTELVKQKIEDHDFTGLGMYQRYSELLRPPMFKSIPFRRGRSGNRSFNSEEDI